MKTGELLARLKRHYIKPGAPLPGGVFLPEVGWNPAGGLSGRDGGCDAIYVGFTSTSGRILVGHELKVSRSDWLNELNKPGKADAWADECHEWWLVVNDPGIVHDGELPAGWGLMSPGKSKVRMQIHQKADRKGTEHTPSWRACRSIMARHDTLRANAIAEIRRKASDEARRDLGERVDAEVQRRLAIRPDAETLLNKLQRIEQALGAEIDWSDSEKRWVRDNRITLDDIEAAAALIRTCGTVDRAVEHFTEGYAVPTTQVRNILQQFERHVTRLDHALAALKDAHTAEPQQLELA